MFHPLLIFPNFDNLSDACGQIARHFVSGLGNDYKPTVLASDRWSSDICASTADIKIVKESRSLLNLEKALLKLGLRDLTQIPDVLYYSWGTRAIKEGIEYCETNGIDYLHSINNPVSSHLVAYRIKMATGLPWVAQLYDPWQNNPFRKHRFNYLDKKDGKRERLVAENADVILFPNQELMDSWADLYGDIVIGKMRVLSFVLPEPLVLNHEQNSKLTISHIGTLSKERNSLVFLQALKKMLSDVPEFKNRIQVNYVGVITPEERDFISSNSLLENVNILGRLKEEECEIYYNSSDLFLIIDIDCTPNLFYPSKLLKYFYYQRPIVGLTKQGSVVSNELVKTGNYPFAYDDVEGLSSFLKSAVNDYDSINRNDKSYWRRFSVGEVTREYNDIIKGLFAK